MTAAYKKKESLEAFEALVVRPDRLPSTSRQTVLDRALDSWQAVNHWSCSQGFVSNGIANRLDGSQDGMLTMDVREYWHDLDMPRLRAKIMEEVAAAVEAGRVSSFGDYQTLLEKYDEHAPMQEGMEAFGNVAVDGEVVVADATSQDEGTDDDDDDQPHGGGGGPGGPSGGSPPAPPAPPPSPPPSPPPPPGPASEEPDDDEGGPGGPPPLPPPPFPPPPGGSGSGGPAGAPVAQAASGQAGERGAAAAAPAASSQAFAPEAKAATVTHPFMEEASRQITDSLLQQKLTIESTLQAAARVGGDRGLEETLRCRLREVEKKLLRSGDETRTCLRAMALERQAKIEIARAESKAEDARARELKLLLDLRKAEAEIAKAKSKEAAVAAKGALEAAKKEKEEAARLRAKAEEDDRKLRAEFAAALIGQMDEYLREGPKGQERRERCQRLALGQARRRAGMQQIDVPRFWAPTTSGLRQVTAGGAVIRLRAKSEVLHASPEFTWALLGHQKYGSEGKWSANKEPRYAFRLLVERTMPGYFDVLGCRYGVDNLLAECRCILDLAFVAAAWRYTKLVGKQFFRCGLAEWPPCEPWWIAKLGAGPASSPAAAAEPAAGGHEGCSSSASASAAASGEAIGHNAAAVAACSSAMASGSPSVLPGSSSSAVAVAAGPAVSSGAGAAVASPGPAASPAAPASSSHGAA